MNIKQKLVTALGIITSISICAVVARKNQFPERLWNDEGDVALNRQQVTMNDLGIINNYFQNYTKGQRAVIEYGEADRDYEREIKVRFEGFKLAKSHQYFGNIKGCDIFTEEIHGNKRQAIFFQDKYNDQKPDDKVILIAIVIPYEFWPEDKTHQFVNSILPELLDMTKLARENRREVIEKYIMDKSANLTR